MLVVVLIVIIVLYSDVINGYISSSISKYYHSSSSSISLLLSKQKDIQTTAMKARSFKEYLHKYVSQYDSNTTTAVTTSTTTNDTNHNSNKRDKVLMIIDGDNVRGKTKFQLSKEQLSDCVEQWMQDCGLHGKVCLMYDHGSAQTGYVLPTSGLAICFSGSSLSLLFTSSLLTLSIINIIIINIIKIIKVLIKKSMTLLLEMSHTFNKI